MKSLILLQAGSAMGGGFDPGFDRLAVMGWKAVALIAGCTVFYYLMKSLWPGEKW